MRPNRTSLQNALYESGIRREPLVAGAAAAAAGRPRPRLALRGGGPLAAGGPRGGGRVGWPSRVARLAEKEGSRTRAILKLVGRGAITLAALAFDAGVWLIGALFAVFGFMSALKSATERMALRYFRRRREKRRLKQLRPIAVALAHG